MIKLAVTGGEGLAAYYWKNFEKLFGWKIDLYDANPINSYIKKIPFAFSEDFITFITKLAQNYDFLILGVDEEIWHISEYLKNKTNSEFDINKFLVPLGGGILKICDKFILGNLLEETGIAYPQTIKLENFKYEENKNWYIKRRMGHGAKDFVPYNFYSVQTLSNNIENYIVQEFISGEIIHFDVLITDNNYYFVCRISQRLLGFLDRDFKIRDCREDIYLNFIEKIVKLITKYSKNKTFIIGIDAIKNDEQIYCIEINPRPSVYFPFLFSEIKPFTEIFKCFIENRKLINKDLERDIFVKTYLRFLKFY